VDKTHRARGRTITGADVANFAGVSGDFNEPHTDAEAMADSQFGERIAHGALVCSVDQNGDTVCSCELLALVR
jgi:acyl dehydratase